MEEIKSMLVFEKIQTESWTCDGSKNKRIVMQRDELETMRVMADEGKRNVLLISVYSLNEQYKRQLYSTFE